MSWLRDKTLFTSPPPPLSLFHSLSAENAGQKTFLFHLFSFSLRNNLTGQVLDLDHFTITQICLWSKRTWLRCGLTKQTVRGGVDGIYLHFMPTKMAEDVWVVAVSLLTVKSTSFEVFTKGKLLLKVVHQKLYSFFIQKRCNFVRWLI